MKSAQTLMQAADVPKQHRRRPDAPVGSWSVAGAALSVSVSGAALHGAMDVWCTALNSRACVPCLDLFVTVGWTMARVPARWMRPACGVVHGHHFHAVRKNPVPVSVNGVGMWRARLLLPVGMVRCRAAPP